MNVLNNCSINNGRLEVPALWNDQLHRLPPNYKLAKNVLSSVYRKLNDNPDKLKQYNEVIKQQVRDGIIEKIDLDSIKSNPNVSFLGHNAVFRENVEWCTYWSNLSEKGGENLSHNQVSLPGPNMNSSIQLSLTLLRFNKFLSVFDWIKAFHQLLLSEEDTNKLHFLWYEDIANSNNSIVAYKMKRIPFGLRFSPFLLMILHVYTISVGEISMRNMLFNLSYMDNLAFTAETSVELDEVVNVSIRKANKEVVRRHVSDIVLLEKGATSIKKDSDNTSAVRDSTLRRSPRIASKLFKHC